MFAIAMFDKSMRYIAASKAWLKTYQIESDIIGKLHYDVFPNHPDHWIAAHEAGLRGETVIKNEEEVEYPIGVHQWVRWHVLPWYLDEDEIGGILLTTEDINERKRREKELNTLVGRFELIQQAAKIGMWDWNITQQQIVLNAEYYEILGRNNRESIAYDDFLKLIHPEDVSRVTEAMKVALNGGGKYSSEFRIYRENDKKLRWVKDQGNIEFNDNEMPIRAYGAIIDVTEQKLLNNDQLRKAGENFQNFIHATLEGIWVVDRNGVTTFINSAVTKMIGYSEEELIGKSMFTFSDPEWNKISFKKFSDRANGKSERYKFQLRHKNGSGIWCLISANPIFEEGEFIGTVTVITDFSEYMKADLAKDERIQELERLLAQYG